MAYVFILSLRNFQVLMYFSQLSDTLLSILANRGGQMVKSIFENSDKWDDAEVLGYEGRA